MHGMVANMKSVRNFQPGEAKALALELALQRQKRGTHPNNNARFGDSYNAHHKDEDILEGLAWCASHGESRSPEARLFARELIQRPMPEPSQDPSDALYYRREQFGNPPANSIKTALAVNNGHGGKAAADLRAWSRSGKPWAHYAEPVCDQHGVPFNSLHRSLKLAENVCTDGLGTGQLYGAPFIY